MTLLADLTLRSSLLVLAGLGASLLLRHRSAAIRHAVLAGTTFAAAIVFPLGLLMPSWGLPGFTNLPPTEMAFGGLTGAAETSSTPLATISRPAPAISITQSLAFVWAGGVAVGAGVLFTGLLRLRRVANRARKAKDDRWTRILAEVSAAYGLRRRIEVCYTEAPDLLATFGLFRPRVLLPAHAAGWNDGRVRVVLSHEIAHVRRHDWIVQMSADVLRMVYWFNPLFWVVCTRLRRESEQACDDVVLTSGVRATDYAAHLLELARTCRRRGSAWAAATPIARPSTLERRFAAMLNPTLDRRPVSFGALVLAALVLLGITLPIAAFSGAQTAPLRLTGSVYDATGAVLPEVNLTVENAQQNSWQAVSNASGRFEFPLLEPGTYVLRASLRGFRALSHDLTLTNARDWDRAITLQVGELRESINVREQRPTSASAPAVSKSPKPIRVGGNIRAPRKLLDVRPVYPPSMRDAGREGIVPIDAVIGQDGTVHAVRVLSANVHPDFAVAAAEAVRQWRFDPTLLNGQPVDVTMTVTVTFSLSD